jgi:integrase
MLRKQKGLDTTLWILPSFYAELIKDITFHDLRHDFAHRCREAGWTLEEIAYYLGHITKQGAPAIQTTARYTQVSREQIKEKLKLL